MKNEEFNLDLDEIKENLKNKSFYKERLKLFFDNISTLEGILTVSTIISLFMIDRLFYAYYQIAHNTFSFFMNINSSITFGGVLCAIFSIVKNISLIFVTDKRYLLLLISFYAIVYIVV